MKLKFEYESNLVEFSLILSKRKTMSIEISAEGEVKVRAPIDVPEEIIIEQVRKKGKWIIEKKEQAENRIAKRVDKSYKDGDLFMYLGNEYPLKIKYSPFLKGVSVQIREEKLVVHMVQYDKEKIKRAIELWYREEGLKIIKERIKHYLSFYPLKPRSIKVKEQKRRWGSCTYYNDLLFNWRCIMAPMRVLDYIVVHEMTHMIHKNHSKNYWEAVAKIMPDYEEKKIWLKENGIKMDI
ncbi:M48 family metallopeptidase [Clostridium perfringens]|nr:M48 family metallopeptidase [Clostridium perfringens]